MTKTIKWTGLELNGDMGGVFMSGALDIEDESYSFYAPLYGASIDLTVYRIIGGTDALELATLIPLDRAASAPEAEAAIRKARTEVQNKITQVLGKYEA